MGHLYVGIDVSKHSLDVAATVDGKSIASMRKVENAVSGWKALLEWASRHVRKLRCEGVHFCLEATGVYSEGVFYFLQEQPEVKVSMVNPLQIKAFGKSRLLRTKTDKADAALIAVYVAVMNPSVTAKTPEELKELRILMRHLDHLIARRGEENGRLESAKNPLVVKSIKESVAHYDKQIGKVEEVIREHIDRYPDLKNKLELLKTIPGIGTATGMTLLCELHSGDGKGKISRKAQTAHAGLAPRQRQSGISVNGKPRLCKTGNARLRKCLYFPAVAAVRFNPLVSEFYERLIMKGKPKMVALAAAMRKLLMIAIGVLNNGVPFRKDWAGKRQCV